MAHSATGLARQLRAFFATLSGAGRRNTAHHRSDERDQLATELLKTLSPQVLAATGHWKRLAPAAIAARGREDRGLAS